MTHEKSRHPSHTTGSGKDLLPHQLYNNPITRCKTSWLENGAVKPPCSFEWARAVGKARISKAQKAILNAIVSHIDLKTHESFASIKRLAGVSGYTDRWARKVFNDLVESGVVIVLYRTAGGRRSNGHGLTHRYRLDYQKICELGLDPHPNLASQNPEFNSSNPELNVVKGEVTTDNQPPTNNEIDQRELRRRFLRHLSLRDVDRAFEIYSETDLGVVLDGVLEEAARKKIRNPGGILLFRLFGNRSTRSNAADLTPEMTAIQSNLKLQRQNHGINV